MLTDLRHAFRILFKSPGFNTLIVVVLAVGIGANTAIFSIVNGVLLKPLPFAEASRLVSIRSVLRQALRLGAAGLGIGLLGALGVTRVLDSLLFGVSAHDPLTFIGVSAMLLVVLVAAAYLPARRATRVDPVVALRTE